MSVACHHRNEFPVPRSVLLTGVVGVLSASLLITLYGFAQQQLVLVAAGVLAAPVGLVMFRWPDAATLGVAGVLYTNAADVAVTFYNVPYVVGAGFVLLLVAPLAKHLLVERKPLVIQPILPLVALFLVVHLAGVILAKDRGHAMHHFILFACEGFGLYLLVSNVVRTPQLLRAVTWVLLGCGAFLGSLSCLQQATGSYNNHYGGFAQIDSKGFSVSDGGIEYRQPRLGGPVGEQNRYAQIMLMLVPLGIFQMLSEQRLLLRLLAIAATALTVAGMTLAFSRGAAVGAAVVLAVIAALRYINLRQVGYLMAGAAAMLVVFPQYLERITSLRSLSAFTSNELQVGAIMPDGALNSRTTIMLCSWQTFLDYPAVGVGPGMFPLHYQDYARWVGRDYEESRRPPHNLYLGVAAEHGVLGVICFLLILFITLRDLHRARRASLSRRPDLAHLTTAYMLAIVSYMATGIGLHFAFVRFFWFMLAMAGSASYIAWAELAKQSELGDRYGNPVLDTGQAELNPYGPRATYRQRPLRMGGAT